MSLVRRKDRGLSGNGGQFAAATASGGITNRSNFDDPYATPSAEVDAEAAHPTETSHVHKRPAVLFDVDGTLANVRALVFRYLDPQTRITPEADNDAFHRATVDVEPHDWVVEDAQAWNDAGVTVLTMTARREKWRPHTQEWLERNNVPTEQLLMRGDDDDRPDEEVKRDLISNLRREFDIVQTYDDNPAIVELWDSMGLPVTVVPGWDFTPADIGYDPNDP